MPVHLRNRAVRAGCQGSKQLFLHISERSIWSKNRNAVATLSRKYQIAIPKSVREEQHWEAGQEFVFIPKGRAALIMPVPVLDELRGIAQAADSEDYRDRTDRY